MAIYSFAYSLPYILVFLIIFLHFIPVGTSTDNFDKKLYYIKHYLVIILLIVFIGLRGYIHSDWESYTEYFKRVPSLIEGADNVSHYLTHSKRFEIGFELFSIICKTISSNYFVFQIINFLFDLYFICLTIKYYFNKRYSLFFLATFLTFYGYAIEINIIRNSKAIVLFLYSIRYVHTRSIIKYMFINVLGCMFHISGIIYLPIYFLIKRQYNKNILIVLYLIGNVLYLLQVPVFTTILENVVGIFSSKAYIYVKLINYMNSDFYISKGLSFGYIEKLITSILVLKYEKKIVNTDNRYIPFFNLVHIFLLIYLYCSDFILIVERIGTLFICSLWVIYPAIYRKMSTNRKTIFFIYNIFLGCARIYAGNSSIGAKYTICFNSDSEVAKKNLLDEASYGKRRGDL
ncbi:hypothetical protein AGMMS49928_28060 [Spirochaetia bacterium]|nr:hypothetical protein AGMMS49928_28060 [Spirochaetia bacterium]